MYSVTKLSNNRRLFGCLITGAGVLILSFDGILIRLSGMDAADATFIRSVLIAATLSFYLWVANRSSEFIELKHSGYLGLCISFLYGLTNGLFVFAISHTTVANAIAILSSTPLFAAIFSRFLLSETLTKLTLVAVVMAISGVLVILYASLDGGGWFGNSLALILAIFSGLMFTLLRKHPNIKRIPAIATGAALSAVIILPWVGALPSTITALACLILVGCVVKPLASVLILTAPRYISAPEVGLFMLLEAVAAPLWAWLLINESLQINTIIGGSIVVGAVAFYLADVMSSRRLK